MSRKSHAITAMLLLLALALAGTGPAMAGSHHDLYENEVAERSTLGSEDIDDDMLAGFYIASRNVAEVRAEYTEQIRNADESDRADLRRQANEGMARVIENADMDVETYREIGYLLHNDDELLRRLNNVVAGMR